MINVYVIYGTLRDVQFRVLTPFSPVFALSMDHSESFQNMAGRIRTAASFAPLNVTEPRAIWNPAPFKRRNLTEKQKIDQRFSQTRLKLCVRGVERIRMVTEKATSSKLLKEKDDCLSQCF